MKRLFPLSDIKTQFGFTSDELHYVIKKNNIKIFYIGSYPLADPSQFELSASSDEIFLETSYCGALPKTVAQAF